MPTKPAMHKTDNMIFPLIGNGGIKVLKINVLGKLVVEEEVSHYVRN
jgi:hypothetical protein